MSERGVKTLTRLDRPLAVLAGHRMTSSTNAVSIRRYLSGSLRKRHSSGAVPPLLILSLTLVRHACADLRAAVVDQHAVYA